MVRSDVQKSSRTPDMQWWSCTSYIAYHFRALRSAFYGPQPLYPPLDEQFSLRPRNRVQSRFVQYASFHYLLACKLGTLGPQTNCTIRTKIATAQRAAIASFTGPLSGRSLYYSELRFGHDEVRREHTARCFLAGDAMAENLPSLASVGTGIVNRLTWASGVPSYSIMTSPQRHEPYDVVNWDARPRERSTALNEA